MHGRSAARCPDSHPSRCAPRIPMSPAALGEHGCQWKLHPNTSSRSKLQSPRPIPLLACRTAVSCGAVLPCFRASCSTSLRNAADTSRAAQCRMLSPFTSWRSDTGTRVCYAIARSVDNDRTSYIIVNQRIV